jgi:hypothetical protein
MWQLEHELTTVIAAPLRARCGTQNHTTRHTTRHTTHHKATFATLRVKASIARRYLNWINDFRQIVGGKCGGRVWCYVVLALFAGRVAAADPDALGIQAKPFVDKFCVGCHNAKKDSGGLNLAMPVDRATWVTVKRRVEMREMPPKNKPAPADADRAKFVAMVDVEMKKLPAGPASPGRVTMRRLNRVEYNRTIHDLCGIDFTPADDFPSDDVGHGFDNIGDVLSMPPILLEKYLTAAERVVDRTLNGEPAKPVSKRYRAQDLTPSNKAELKDRDGRKYRHLDTAGSVYIDHTFASSGEATIRGFAFGAPFPGNRKLEAVKFAMRIDAKEFSNERLPTNTFTGVEGKVRVTAGSHRIALALLNPSDDEVKDERRTLGVAAIEIIEPIAVSSDKPASYKLVMPGDVKDESRDRARKILVSFAKRAYRRPTRGDEVERLMKLFDMTRESDNFDKAVGIAMQAVLCSPHFIFRVEPDRTPDRPDGSYPLNSWEIASRLSYFLWSTMPDTELFSLAEQGKLQDPAVREQQVRRMLKDPKVAALVQNFGGQWLNLRNLAVVQPARRDFPIFDEPMRGYMRIETEMFFESIIKEDRSILDLIDADYTFVNQRLARLYKIDGVTGDEFRRVQLTDRNRGGVLTQASVLTVTSNPTRTSPVKRGKWILENILGAPPPPPPPDVPELKEDREARSSASLRERMQQHRLNPNCATCHERMDTLGFGFENFDAVGGWRTDDGKFKIDASGTLPDGKSFATPAELKKLLTRDAESFRRCLTEKLLTYALGRGVDRNDRPEVERIAKGVAAKGNKFNAMVLEIVQGDAFVRRTVRK